MEVRLIDTGYFHADGGAMFGAIPKTSWSRRYPSDEKNGCILAMRTAVIRTGNGRVILVDTGAGEKQLRLLSFYHFFDLKDLVSELEKLGISPGQVTDVILTHLHFDHCGDATRRDPETGRLVPTFPRANYWVGKAQWENFQRPNPLEADSFFLENMSAVEESGLLRLVDKEIHPDPSVELKLYDGHTPGQLVPYIYLPNKTIVFAGDVIPLAASVSPTWISAYDTYPVASYYSKVRLLEKAAAEGQILVYCHDAYIKASTVKKINDFFKPEQTEGFFDDHFKA